MKLHEAQALKVMFKGFEPLVKNYYEEVDFNDDYDLDKFYLTVTSSKDGLSYSMEGSFESLIIFKHKANSPNLIIQTFDVTLGELLANHL